MAERRGGRSGRVWAGLLGLVLAGCGEPKSPPTEAPKVEFPGVSLSVAVIGDPAIVPGLRSQQGEWAASTGARVSFADTPAGLDAVGSSDLIVFPGDRLGDLVDRGRLARIDDATLRPPSPPPAEPGEPAPEPPPDPFALKEIVAPDRDQVTRYGDDRMALPLGGSALVVAFRRDAFDRPEIKAAAQAAGIAPGPPTTWDDLDALARFFHGRDWDGDGAADAGIALAWGADAEGVGDATFLARAASLGQHRDQYSFLFDSERMAPRIASPPFVEALGAIVALAKFGPDGAARFDIGAARAAFRSGKAAILIDRAERASTWSDGKPIGVFPLPGSGRVYNPDLKLWEPEPKRNTPSYLPRGGGWLVGVSATSAHPDAALDLARYLAGPEVTNRLRGERSFPMLATRSPQVAQGLTDPGAARGVEARGWSDAVGRTLFAARAVVGLRIPSADAYLADLTAGRVAAVAGEAPEAALAGVARAWDARTDALGRDRQTWHYRRSLNRLATTSEPPSRGH